MKPALLSLAWSAWALALAARVGRRRFAFGTLTDAERRPPSERDGRQAGRVVLEKTGRLVLALARRPSPAPARARVVGVAALATGAVLLLSPILAPVPALVAYLGPRLAARRLELRRLRRMEADLPEMVDLLSLAVSSGCNVNLAVVAAGRRGVGPLAAELRRVGEEVAWGRRLADALEDLPARAGEVTRPLASALAACERYGAPLAPALQRLSDEVRRHRRRRAEEAARRVPVMLLFPLVLCILPAFALLTVAPLIAGAVRELNL